MENTDLSPFMVNIDIDKFLHDDEGNPFLMHSPQKTPAKASTSLDSGNPFFVDLSKASTTLEEHKGGIFVPTPVSLGQQWAGVSIPGSKFQGSFRTAPKDIVNPNMLSSPGLSFPVSVPIAIGSAPSAFSRASAQF